MRKRKIASTEQSLLLTIDEARALLQYGKDTMRGLIESGKIACIRQGRTVRIPRQAVLNYINAQCKQQAG
jgi:excisionase family DNA binding protein